jgi:protoporphyrinogen oxidase
MIVAQSKISDNDAIYVPESQYIFFRIEQYKFWSAKMVPDPKKTSLCLEITCFKDDQLWKMADEKILARSIDDLVKAGLIKNKRVVEDYWIVRQNHVYPVFEIGYQERIKPIKNWVDQIPNLISYGRQGSYKYIHMHHVITQGFRAAEYLQGKIKKEGIFEIGTQGEYFG